MILKLFWFCWTESLNFAFKAYVKWSPKRFAWTERILDHIAGTVEQFRSANEITAVLEFFLWELVISEKRGWQHDAWVVDVAQVEKEKDMWKTCQSEKLFLDTCTSGLFGWSMQQCLHCLTFDHCIR